MTISDAKGVLGMTMILNRSTISSMTGEPSFSFGGIFIKIS